MIWESYWLLFLLFVLRFNALDETFFSASRVGDVDKMKEMLIAGFDVHSVDAKGNSALIIASGRGRVEAIRILLAHNASVEFFTLQGLFQGKTALMWASSQGRVEAVTLLIQAGASVHREMDSGVFQGKTALMWASSQGRYEVVRVLLSATANVDHFSRIGNFKGKTALMWASSQGRLETVNVLLEAGAAVNMADNDGITALMWAAGSETDDSDGHKKGLLEKANKGHTGTIKLLLQYGAKPDLQDNDGISPLMYASFHGHLEAVEALLIHGADSSLRDKDKKTALDFARGAGQLEVVKLLVKGPKIMERSTKDLLAVSTCGWVISTLRDYRTAYGDSGATPVPTILNSCRTLSMNGLDGTLADLVYIAKHSSVDEVIAHLGIKVFASQKRAKGQLSELIAAVGGTSLALTPQSLSSIHTNETQVKPHNNATNGQSCSCSSDQVNLSNPGNSSSSTRSSTSNLQGKKNITETILQLEQTVLLVKEALEQCRQFIS